MHRVGIVSEPTDGVLILAFQELPDGETIMFMRELGPSSPKDLALGWDQPSVIADNGGAAYGAVRSWTLAECDLTVDLDQAGAQSIGLPETLTFQVPTDKVPDVEAMLRRLFPEQ